jgi:hypothetical protein
LLDQLKQNSGNSFVYAYLTSVLYLGGKQTVLLKPETGSQNKHLFVSLNAAFYFGSIDEVLKGDKNLTTILKLKNGRSLRFGGG